jgi:hypothetical protein
LEVIRKLRDIMPIARANMLLRIIFKEIDYPIIQKEITALHAIVHYSHRSDDAQTEQFLDLIVDPEHFRRLEEMTAGLPSTSARLDVLQLRMTGAGGITGTGIAVAEEKEEEEEGKIEEITTTNNSNNKTKGESRRKEKSRGEDLQALLTDMGALPDGDEMDEELTQSSMSSSQKVRNIAFTCSTH